MKFFLLSFLACAQEFVSTDKNTLIELYTSQGCSSCPPADEYMKKFNKDPLLWKKIFPVAFHVTYWNYLGWKDPFGSTKYNDRQKMLVGEGTIYTPQFIQNGKTTTYPFVTQFQPRKGILKVKVNKEVKITYKKKDLNYSVVYLKHQKTKILRGENAGRSYDYPYTVMKYEEGSFDFEKILDRPKEKFDYIVVWLGKDKKIIQVTGGILKN